MPFDSAEGGGEGNGFLSRLKASIGQPFQQPVTWTRLALIVAFVLVVIMAWRQSILFIAKE